MLQVEDVEASSRWYQQILGLVSGHGGPDYEMLFAGTPFESDLLLQLHRWDAHEHGFLGDPAMARGNGCSLWFQVADEAALAAVWDRVKANGVEILAEPSWNPLAHHRELTVRDRDGYVVVAATPYQPG